MHLLQKSVTNLSVYGHVPSNFPFKCFRYYSKSYVKGNNSERLFCEQFDQNFKICWIRKFHVWLFDSNSRCLHHFGLSEQQWCSYFCPGVKLLRGTDHRLPLIEESSESDAAGQFPRNFHPRTCPSPNQPRKKERILIQEHMCSSKSRLSTRRVVARWGNSRSDKRTLSLSLSNKLSYQPLDLLRAKTQTQSDTNNEQMI